ATGCTTQISWSDADYLNMKINLPLADAYEANAAALGLKFVDCMLLPHAGADMANVSQRVPALTALSPAFLQKRYCTRPNLRLMRGRQLPRGRSWMALRR